MNSIAILQARTDSSRLPGKVLLPVGGYPMAVLSALRASNNGSKVVLATSAETTDDALAKELERNEIEFFRGSLQDVLKRFVDAAESYDDTTLVFRLTADNVFPDGNLLKQMEEYFISRAVRYLTTGGECSGLPYGVSVELMYLGDLREAADYAQNRFDREHVTPWIRRKHGVEVFKFYQSLGMSHYRATVDIFSDYVAIRGLFDEVDDPVNAGFEELSMKLKGRNSQPSINHPAKKIVVGGVQLGLDYGINNDSGQPSLEEAKNIVREAIVNGVEYLDTARAYGESEKVLGYALAEGWKSRARVITKLSPLDDCSADADKSTLRAFVDASVNKSCRLLRTQSLDTLLVHRAGHIIAWDGRLWKYLNKLQQEGVVEKLGASVQTPEELDLCLAEQGISHVQMPFNIADYRWNDQIPAIEKARKEKNLTVHTRSALLQGLLVSNEQKHWKMAGVSNQEQVRNWLVKCRGELGARSVAELCVGFCMSQKWIDGVVIGVENLSQLRDNLLVAQSDWEDVDWTSCLENRPAIDKKVFDPSSWKNS